MPNIPAKTFSLFDPGGAKGVAVVQLLLSAAPHTTSIGDKYGHSPLDWALERVKRELTATEQLSSSDPLIAMLRTGKLVEVGRTYFSLSCRNLERGQQSLLQQ